VERVLREASLNLKEVPLDFTFSINLSNVAFVALASLVCWIAFWDMRR